MLSQRWPGTEHRAAATLALLGERNDVFSLESTPDRFQTCAFRAGHSRARRSHRHHFHPQSALRRHYLRKRRRLRATRRRGHRRDQSAPSPQPDHPGHRERAAEHPRKRGVRDDVLGPKPVDLAKSNHTLVYDVVNRGNKLITSFLNVGTTTANP